MESKNMNHHIKLSVNYRNLKCEELYFENMNESISILLNQLFFSVNGDVDVGGDKELAGEERMEIFNQIIQMARDQLKGSSTVGQILDIMKFSVKMLVVEKGGGSSVVTTNDVLLLNEIFQLLPEQWAQDPVKVHLITKVIYETLERDFNNTMHVLSKIITVNKLGFYVAMTLFWALFLSFFKKDSHHYYKMYDRNKFFKQLHSLENKEMDLDAIFQLLMLISIYENYVLLSKDTSSENHQVFADFFRPSSSYNEDLERLKKYLINVKTLIEIGNSTGGAKNDDALMLLEFLELDLIKAINETTMTTKSDGSNQHLLEADLEAVAPQREEEGDE